MALLLVALLYLCGLAVFGYKLLVDHGVAPEPSQSTLRTALVAFGLVCAVGVTAVRYWRGKGRGAGDRS